jgi:hypothetical protein
MTREATTYNFGGLRKIKRVMAAVANPMLVSWGGGWYRVFIRLPLQELLEAYGRNCRRNCLLKPLTGKQ